MILGVLSHVELTPLLTCLGHQNPHYIQLLSSAVTQCTCQHLLVSSSHFPVKLTDSGIQLVVLFLNLTFAAVLIIFL